MARENADLIVRNVCLLAPIWKSGACAYHNIQQFSQLHLTACISGLLITLVATMHSGESPLSAIHLIWVNLIMCLLGGLMMVMELQGPELLTQKPAKRTESLITKVIRRNIAIQVSSQASVLLILHFMGNAVPGMDQGIRNTMIFNTFTLCQVMIVEFGKGLVSGVRLNALQWLICFLLAALSWV
ncbi:calcium-transporting ATPase 12 plasma membrane-type isoform X1 [Prunus yedoensis var. nudiflora]|uniref:Calcium-transporting ATPase 12 plasma membrane-type isoform X1 n=1 Tax=Prunus yedoensis var. nudiflora TaxID=2094558 RepID=A0A314UWF8_PRUYE|nr:calcium-transporting ATPase 12 plasma membrane-type isoform X1 [Prunus yedoensis var. nudiflora]